MALPDYHGFSVVSIDYGAPTGEVYTVLPVGDISIKTIPYIPGKSSVIELLDGSRIIAPNDGDYHVDIEITWKEIGDVKWPDLVAWVKEVVANQDKTFYFYPVANAARTAPDGVNAAVEVIPELTDDLIEIAYKDRVRERGAKLMLKGKAPIAAGSLPAWTTQ